MTATIHDGNDIGIMHPLATDAVALKEQRTLFERIARRRKGSKRRAYVVERGKRFVRRKASFKHAAARQDDQVLPVNLRRCTKLDAVFLKALHPPACFAALWGLVDRRIDQNIGVDHTSIDLSSRFSHVTAPPRHRGLRAAMHLPSSCPRGDAASSLPVRLRTVRSTIPPKRPSPVQARTGQAKGLRRRPPASSGAAPAIQGSRPAARAP